MNSHKNNIFKFQALRSQFITKTILFVLFLIYGSIVNAQVYIDYQIRTDDFYANVSNDPPFAWSNEEAVWNLQYKMSTTGTYSDWLCFHKEDDFSPGAWWNRSTEVIWTGKCLDTADEIIIGIKGWENDEGELCTYDNSGINQDNDFSSDVDSDLSISAHNNNTWEPINNEGNNYVNCGTDDDNGYYKVEIDVWWNYSIPVNPSFSITNVTTNSFTINKTSDNNYRITNWDYEVSTNSDFTDIVNSDTGVTSNNVNVTALVPGNTYYIRIRGTNEAGTGDYTSSQIQIMPPTYPIVSTNAISNIEQTTATSGGYVTYDGGTTITDKGICWSTTSPAIYGDTHTSNGTGSGTYTSQITDLTANTTYYVRAYAENSVGIVYGSELSFTTLGIPTITSNLTTSITGTTAIGNGNISHLGNPNPSQYGVCWSTSENPTISGNKTEMGEATTTGAFQSQITGLSVNTLYYVKAYATNSQGTVYGIQYSFRTLGPPTIETNQTTSIAGTDAVCNGNVINLGNPNPTQHGVCWSTEQNPSTSGNKTEMGANSFEGTFQSKINDLEPGTLYYVRAYATNTQGTAYGSQISFTTLPFPGNGSSSEPFQISTLEDLRYISEHTDYWNKEYIQTADIDATASSTWNDDLGWLPIGNNVTKFTGIYNGDNHTINNLSINRPTTNYCGLFGETYLANIKNLGIDNSNITGKNHVGALVGKSSNSEITNCHTIATIVGQDTVGGFIGENYLTIINYCYSIIDVEADFNAGGFAGYNYVGTIDNCYSKGNVNCNNNFSSTVGSFVGSSIQGFIQYCFTIGYVNFTEGNSYYQKGFIGSLNQDKLTITNGNFFNVETSNQTSGNGATSKNTAQMNDISTFVDANWDLVGQNKNDIWDMDGITNEGYPFLSQQNERKEWIGATNNDPSIATNWNGSVVPTSSENIILSATSTNSMDIAKNSSNPEVYNSITIENGAFLNIDAGKALTVSNMLFNNGNLTIESNSSGSGSLIVGNIEGNVITQRYIGAASWTDWQDGWHFVSSPVANYEIQDNFTVATSNEYDFFAWSEVDNLWINFKNEDTPSFETVNGSENFILGKAYLSAYKSEDTKIFNGNINVDDVAISDLTFTNTNENNLSWHLLGNPFTSAIIWDASSDWKKNNIAGTAQIWNEAGKSYSAITAGGVIPSTNGFMVQVVDATGSITIPKSKRTHNSTPFYKNSGFPIIKLKANSLDIPSFQETQLLFNPQSTDGYEMEFDGDFLAAYAPQFYSLIDGKPMSVNSMPEISESIEIPLSFIKNEDNNFSIELYVNENIELDIWLLDKKLNKDHNLSLNNTYLFSSFKEDDENRFVLHFSPVGIEEIQSKEIQLWVSKKTINIQNKQYLKGEINLINLMGQIVNKYKLTGEVKQEISLNSKSGFYIVNINHQNGNESIKVILR